jgi:hypothetical protein
MIRFKTVGNHADVICLAVFLDFSDRKKKVGFFPKKGGLAYAAIVDVIIHSLLPGKQVFSGVGHGVSLVIQVTVTLKVTVTFGFVSLQIQRQQFLQNLFIRQVVLPAVGGEDGIVESFVCQFQPGGTLVVEVGEGAL